MRINSLSLSNFRNYKKTSITLSPSINVFIGDNAAGKTNILESIYVLSLGRSYKTKDKDIILNDSQFYKITAKIAYYDREEEFVVIATKDGKRVAINNVEEKKLSDYVGKFNVVLFSPEDIFMFKNGPQEKRRLLDLSLFQIDKTYLDDFNNFRKQLKLRNDYLKYLYSKSENEEVIKDEMLNVITKEYDLSNQKIFEKRKKFIAKLEEITNEKYFELSGEKSEIKIEYLINFENGIEFYNKRTKQDIQYGATQNGCHRDDLRFLKNGQDFETSCSQGEQRMLALSLKLAIAEILKRIKRESPVVLLDDVFSELDKNHQNRLLVMLDRTMQIIITTTDLQKIGRNALNNAKVFTINHATIRETQIV